MPGEASSTPVRAVLLDYYGTLAEATHWISADDVLAEHGYKLPPETRDRWFNDGIDGIEHLEHSLSRDHYVAWQRERILGTVTVVDQENLVVDDGSNLPATGRFDERASGSAPAPFHGPQGANVG